MIPAFTNGDTAAYVNTDTVEYLGGLKTSIDGPSTALDARFEMPSLFYPGRKPVGSVAINWGNPITKKLARYFILNKVGGLDLTSSSLVPQITTGSHPGIYVNDQTAKGLALIAGGANSDQYLSLGLYAAEMFKLPSSTTTIGNISVTAIFKVDSVSTRGGIFGFPGTASSSNVQLYFESNQLRFSVASFSSYAYKAASLGVWYMATCTYDSASRTAKLYVDGVKGTDFTYGADQSYVTTLPDSAIGAHFATFNRELDGQVAMLCTHNRELSADEIKSFHADPYQFLIPA